MFLNHGFLAGLLLNIPRKLRMYSRVTGWKMMRPSSSTKLTACAGLDAEQTADA